MPMPHRERMKQGLILAAAGGVLASGAVVPAVTATSAASSESKVTQAGHGFDWEKTAPVVKPKRPPNG